MSRTAKPLQTSNKPQNLLSLISSIHTSRMPFVLRPTRVLDKFEFVGDCYMHGFMEGEMLESSPGVKEGGEENCFGLNPLSCTCGTSMAFIILYGMLI